MISAKELLKTLYKNNTVLIDNLPTHLYQNNPNNILIIPPYCYKNYNDEILDILNTKLRAHTIKKFSITLSMT